MKISIITVTYNRAHTIKGAIEGVLRQRFKDYEYIIVDGASKDNTIEILKEYEPKFEGRMLWISEPDKGLYDAINKGFKMAKGEIVGIINSDDFHHRDDAFEIIANAFEKSKADAIYGDSRLLYTYSDGTTKERIHSAKDFKPWMFRIGLMPSHQSFFAKRELFDRLGYYRTDFKITADLELMLRFIYVNKVKTYYVNEPLLTFNIGTGVSTQFSNKMLLNKETVRACKENGLFCCLPMVWLKYAFKINTLIFNLFRH